MSYTWADGELITAEKLNQTSGNEYDAIIRLVHSNDSGGDVPSCFTPSIVSGTFEELSNKIDAGGCPCILVEYEHPWGVYFSAPMAYINYVSQDEDGYILISMAIAGFSVWSDTFKKYCILDWDYEDNLTVR